jgi:uncharacterized protein YtpQ (UPF0354 family)
MQDIIFERLKARLEDLGITIDKVDEEGLVYIEHGENTIKISLDNVRKSYEQEGTFDHLDNLVESIHSHLMEVPIPDWDQAYLKVYCSLFPSDYDFGDFLHEKVTDEFHKTYVFYESEQYIWINHTQLEEWQIDEQTFKQQVAFNMNALLDESSIETTETEDGLKLAFFETIIDGVKSALLFSQNIKEKIEPVLGWPIYCVLPVRDFCYMFSEKDKELLNRLGEIVLDEYSRSAYPVTTEALLISDEGTRTVGKYKE